MIITPLNMCEEKHKEQSMRGEYQDTAVSIVVW